MVAERLTFTLAGRDDLSRVLNGAGDSADRLRLRMAGITADADGQLRDLHGRFLSVADAQRLVDDRSGTVQRSMTSLSDAAGKLGDALKANLISLAPAAIPVVAGLAASATVLAGQLGAVTVAAGAYALALGPQIGAIGEALEAQEKYEQAVESSGATSQEAAKAQAEWARQMEKLPAPTREAAVAVGILKDNYQEWSDSLAGDVMAPFTKGIAVANALLPKTTGLVKGASGEFDRLITLVAGGISTPGFDAMNQRFTTFTNDTLRNGIDALTIFLAKLQDGQYDGGRLREWWDYAQEAGPLVWDTLENVGDALLNVLEAGSGVGVGMLEVINVLSGVVSAVPPEAIATFLQLAIAIKAVKLAAAGGAAASAVMAALGVQIGAMRASAAGAPSALAGVGAAISGLSRTAKLAIAGTGIGLLLITLGELSSASQRPQPDIDQLASSLTELGRSGKVSGEALRVYGKDLSSLSEALDTLYNPSGMEGFLQGWAEFLGMDSTGMKNASEEIDGIDKALASLVSQGRINEAAAAIDMTIEKLGLQGEAAKQFRSELNDHSAALAGHALEQELAAEAMGVFGEQAQQVQGKLDAQKASADALSQSINALSNAALVARGGIRGMEAAIDAADEAFKKNGATLDENTEKGRANNAALDQLASATLQAAESARANGDSWETVNGIYDRGRQKLVESAVQMGLTKGEAKALADQILKTPDKTARLKGDMQDLQEKIDRAKDRLANVPDSRKAQVRAEIYQLEQALSKARRELDAIDGKTSHTYVVTHLQARREGSHGTELGYAQGGPIVGRGGLPGYPGGGLLQGPGTPTSDSILLWGSTGEYMVRASSVEKYGLAFMDALNAGRLPVGRDAAPGRPAAPAAASVVPGGDRPSVTYIVQPRKSVIDVNDLRLIQRQEEARQRVGRPG